MFRTLLISVLTLATLAPVALSQDGKVNETCFGRRRRSEDAMAAFAQRVLAQQQAQIVEARVTNELLLQQLQVQTRQLETQAEIKGFLYAKGQAQAQLPAAPSGQITPAYQVPLPTAPYNVPGPTAPYAVPLPTAPYSVPGPTPTYPVPQPTAPYNVPGPSYEFRLQSPTGGQPSAPSPSIPTPGGGGLNIPGPGVTPMQPIPAPTSARSVAWSRVRR